MATDADRHLLFGLLALQTGLIDQAQLVAAFHAWTRDKARTLADHLVSLGHLDEARCRAVEALVALHAENHGGDPASSLAAIPATGSTLGRLRELGDPELDATIVHLGSGSTEPDPDRTATFTVGTATADGQRFRVLRPHARGGLGAVFVALDAELNREVALKQILDQHADDPASRSRFLLEAEITGGLEHPGIVPVYGLGHYGGGRPYYAMRFVKGDSLKEAIAAFHRDGALKADAGARTLALQKLLRRFLDVCNAIDYAHGRGVLHRDLKPANVIVGRHGETLVVDWGLAKVIGKAEAGLAVDERTLAPAAAGGGAETLPGTAIGTPAYMSPEQAAGDLGRLGPSSDVYALGATLYCLLTGRPPFEGGDVGSILRAVQKGGFPRPRTLDPAIPKALEAICLRAMALRPEDRYATPRALAEDVERWIADEPVAAHREGARERLARWSRAHRAMVRAAAASLVVALVAAALIAAQQARAADRERKIAGREHRARLDEQAARAAEQRALAQARSRLDQLERANGLLLAIFQDLDPKAAGKDRKPLGAVLGERLARASAELEGAAVGDPLMVARMQNALGVSLDNLGHHDKAVVVHSSALRTMEAVLGPDHPQTLSTRNNLAESYRDAGRIAEALALHRTALELFEARLGPDHPETLINRHNLGLDYLAAGRIAEAIALLEPLPRRCESKLGPGHPLTLASRNSLAAAYYGADRNAEAMALFETALKHCEARLGPDHLHTITSRRGLALTYHDAGRHAEALRLNEATLRGCEATLGPDHPDTLESRINVAKDHAALGRHAEALRLNEATLRSCEATLGPGHPLTLACRGDLADNYHDTGRHAEAMALDELTLRSSEATLGPDHPGTLTRRNNLAWAYLDAGKAPEAIALFEATLKSRMATRGPDHPDTLTSRNNLAAAYRDAGRSGEAIAMFEATVKLVESKLGPDHPQTLASRNNLAVAYQDAGRWAESERLYRAVIQCLRRDEPARGPKLVDDLAALGLVLSKQSKWAEAEPVLREALALRTRAGRDTRARFATMSLLGGALLGQGKYAEAEPLLIDGFEGLKARAAGGSAGDRDQRPEAAGRIIRLYEAWGRPEQAESWKQELGLADLPHDVFARP